MMAAIKRLLPDVEITLLPLADGGEGTAMILQRAVGGSWHSVRVRGPLGQPVMAQMLRLRDPEVAVVELAQASGLGLCQPLDPLRASTFGTGELIRVALDWPIEEIWVALGGSATVDGGMGLAQALGYRCWDPDGEHVRLGGGELLNVARIEPPKRTDFKTKRIRGLCDVDAPLLGPKGAARVFGPQKGATPEQVERLEAGLAHLARILERDLGVRVAGIPGAGAAGGAGAGLVAFCGASLESGSDRVLEAVGFERYLSQSDLLITGEGCFDAQSLMGKGVGAVIEQARARAIPTLVIAGQVDPSLAQELADQGIVTASLVAEAGSVAQAMADPLAWIPKAMATGIRQLTFS
jgi:glycerate kinase